MSNILEYRTTPTPIDLTGARPGVDWKGSKDFEQCIQSLYDSGIDWKTQPEKELAKLVGTPDGTRITRLYYKVFLETGDSNQYEYAQYDHCDFPEAMARQMADDDSGKEIEGLFIQMCEDSIYPNGYEDCYVMEGKSFSLYKHTLDKYSAQCKWNVCIVGTFWQADHYTDCEERYFARPGTEAAKQYQVIEPGMPLSLKGLEGDEFFPDPIVTAFNVDGLTFQYDNCTYTITPGEGFISDPTGRDYATFELRICLKLI